MFNYLLKNLSILKKFLFINLIFFSVIGLFTFLYLKNIQPNLIKNKSSNHIKIINNTVDNLDRLEIDFNEEEAVFLENILQYKDDILNESDILIIAQIMRNILDDFSYEFGYINNEDVYDRVFSNFCIGK